MVKLIIFSLIYFIINIFFGYLKADYKKFSFLWWFYLHIPIFIQAIMRKKFLFETKYIFLFVIILFMGQRIGGILNFKERESFE